MEDLWKLLWKADESGRRDVVRSWAWLPPGPMSKISLNESKLHSLLKKNNSRPF